MYKIWIYEGYDIMEGSIG